MTNTPKIVDKIAITNADGSVSVVSVEALRTETEWGVDMTTIEFWIFVGIVVAITLALVYLRKKGNKSN